jgi:hypothetical protein
MKLLVITALLIGSSAFAAKSYQVTGPVLDVTATTITVDKKGEKFEIEKTATTKIEGEVVKGGKVTVQYTMTAMTVEAKAAPVTKEKKAKK